MGDIHCAVNILTYVPKAEYGHHKCLSDTKYLANSQALGSWGRPETPRDPIQSTACPLMFWAEDPATGRWSGEGRWRDAGAPGPVILCRVPADTFRLPGRAPRGLAQHPLRIAIVGLCSPGLTSSLLWGLADRSTRCQGPE